MFEFWCGVEAFVIFYQYVDCSGTNHEFQSLPSVETNGVCSRATDETLGGPARSFVGRCNTSECSESWVQEYSQQKCNSPTVGDTLANSGDTLCTCMGSNVLVNHVVHLRSCVFSVILHPTMLSQLPKVQPCCTTNNPWWLSGAHH